MKYSTRTIETNRFCCFTVFLSKKKCVNAFFIKLLRIPLKFNKYYAFYEISNGFVYYWNLERSANEHTYTCAAAHAMHFAINLDLLSIRISHQSISNCIISVNKCETCGKSIEKEGEREIKRMIMIQCYIPDSMCVCL